MNASILTFRRIFLRLLARRSVVPINRCYHYRGFRYGGFGWNPYEDYIIGLVRDDNRAALRKDFANAVLNSRPRTMGEAVQVDLPDWPAWEFPWNRNATARTDYLSQPEDNPDVICHHCEAGILSSHINREFRWLESALDNIRKSGYQPRSYGFIRCLELVDRDRSSYLVLDGNHRLGALHALGVKSVEIEICPQRIRRKDAHKWPDVRNGRRTLSDAVRLFDRYFSERNLPLSLMNPAQLIVDEPPLWM